ncbi:uncharacterized protein MELLADRAFT_112093 [Melampsora larici-populina 98AG31]|uniref:Subtelomeric hrmA-associated cluster protein AFUB-079030/YDR124W-like helical bundle domain-containing protein n=1 Tax=Melampsora larici-populina (strain 98AG31 / pathotype 3-4-7) TaxID=747676 RepID=F4S5D0_MELLP|nr:uncharacterized protein MELLADRAFT_112093 [Melampsora larici-populina 98AG31]EGG00183.1 hypothetical protein MELLADRAFT_112093 [Melampsora larici-populina 98AG31]
MPRIPTRTTPYDTPNRQHRHFKNKREQILKALGHPGKSSYINGSQFAIVWVSARGETEVYGSPVLQKLFSHQPGQCGLFGPEVLERIRQAAKQAKDNIGASILDVQPGNQPEGLSKKRKSLSASCLASNQLHQVMRDMNDESKENDPSQASSVCSPSPIPKLQFSAKHLEGSLCEDSPNDSSHENEGLLFENSESKSFNKTSDISLMASNFTTPPKSLCPERSATAILRDDSSSKVVRCQSANTIPISSAETTHAGLQSMRELKSSELSKAPRIFKPLPIRPSSQFGAWNEVSFTSPQSISQFLEGKFGQLQQNLCKLVCKAWIKVIEPKKQTKFPYRGGDTRKPDWWPADVRHKEPDHLAKPERMRLMLAILGSGRIEVARLELASAEQAAHITQDKMAILRDIYIVAREEERLRTIWPANGSFRPFKVRLSDASSENDAQCTPSELSCGDERNPLRTTLASLSDRNDVNNQIFFSDSFSPLPDSNQTKMTDKNGVNYRGESNPNLFDPSAKKPFSLSLDSKFLSLKNTEASQTNWTSNPYFSSLGNNAGLGAASAQSTRLPTPMSASTNGLQSYTSQFPSYSIPNLMTDSHTFFDQQDLTTERPNSFHNSTLGQSGILQGDAMGSSVNGRDSAMDANLSPWANLQPMLSPADLFSYSSILPDQQRYLQTGNRSTNYSQSLPMHSQPDMLTKESNGSRLSDTSPYRHSLANSTDKLNDNSTSLALPLAPESYRPSNSAIPAKSTTRNSSRDFSSEIDPWVMVEGDCLSMMGSSLDNSRSYGFISEDPNLSGNRSTVLEPMLGSMSQGHSFDFPNSVESFAVQSNAVFPSSLSNSAHSSSNTGFST